MKLVQWYKLCCMTIPSDSCGNSNFGMHILLKQYSGLEQLSATKMARFHLEPLWQDFF